MRLFSGVRNYTTTTTPSRHTPLRATHTYSQLHPAGKVYVLLHVGLK